MFSSYLLWILILLNISFLLVIPHPEAKVMRILSPKLQCSSNACFIDYTPKKVLNPSPHNNRNLETLKYKTLSHKFGSITSSKRIHSSKLIILDSHEELNNNPLFMNPIDSSHHIRALKEPQFITETITPTPQEKKEDTREKKWKFTRTKQVATLGPASFDEKVVELLFLNGVDIFRLNFSHGIWSEKARLVKIIRGIETKYHHPIAIMADLQGPKIRVGEFLNESVVLKEGTLFKLDTYDSSPGDSSRVHLPHPDLIPSFKVGDSVLVDDGKIRMKVEDIQSHCIICRIERGGLVSSNKGINFPSMVLPISALSEKDKQNASFAKSLGIDLIALSFVQHANDIKELREITGPEVDLIAKIERPSAVEFFESIVAEADGIMLARGDLGVEMNPEEVPVIQKRLINKCRKVGKPVIVATQMLESMITSPYPTRAEVSDVATAIYDGADAVMLSGETAAGSFPIESAKMQQRIIERVEKDKNYWELMKVKIVENEETAMDAISAAASTVSDMVGAKAIVSFTVQGDTVGRISASRPDAPIVAITSTKPVSRKMQLFWGVYPVLTPGIEKEGIESIFQIGCEFARKEGMVTSEDDFLVVTAGVPVIKSGATNILHICKASSSCKFC